MLKGPFGAEATGATFPPPAGTRVVRVSVGGIIEVEHTLGAMD